MIEYHFRIPSAAVFTLYSYSKALEYRFRVPITGSYYRPNSTVHSTCFSSLKKIFSHSARVSNKVEDIRKKFCSDSFCFLFCSTCFRICGISFSYLRKQERGFFRSFLWNPILSGIDPYLFHFSSHFQSIWDMSRNWYVNKPTNHKLCILTY
jgi:hypothetical protein